MVAAAVSMAGLTGCQGDQKPASALRHVISRCPDLATASAEAKRPVHSPASVRKFVATVFSPGGLGQPVAMRYADPAWGKLHPGSNSTPRTMWVVLQREVTAPLPPGFRGPRQPPTGTVRTRGVLVDDALLELAGTVDCRST